MERKLILMGGLPEMKYDIGLVFHYANKKKKRIWVRALREFPAVQDICSHLNKQKLSSEVPHSRLMLQNL